RRPAHGRGDPLVGRRRARPRRRWRRPRPVDRARPARGGAGRSPPRRARGAPGVRSPLRRPPPGPLACRAVVDLAAGDTGATGSDPDGREVVGRLDVLGPCTVTGGATTDRPLTALQRR